MHLVSSRNDTKPQPKPRMSLVKPTRKLSDSLISPCDSISLVQRIKPFFESSSSNPTQHEPKPSRQQRPPAVSIPYTYQTGAACKVTCLDDVLASHVRLTISSSMIAFQCSHILFARKTTEHQHRWRRVLTTEPGASLHRRLSSRHVTNDILPWPSQ